MGGLKWCKISFIHVRQVLGGRVPVMFRIGSSGGLPNLFGLLAVKMSAAVLRIKDHELLARALRLATITGIKQSEVINRYYCLEPRGIYACKLKEYKKALDGLAGGHEPTPIGSPLFGIVRCPGL